MSEWIWMPLSLLGAWLALRLLQFCIVLVHVLRLQLWPTHLQPLAHLDDLSDDQRAAIEEIEALGFQQVASAELEYGPRRYPLLLFRELAGSAFASLLLQPGSSAAYPVVFYSVDDAGRWLLTSNRIEWSVLAAPPEVVRADALADSLEAHWQAHRARLAGVHTRTPHLPEAQRRIYALFEGYLPLLQQCGMAVREAGAWHPSLRGAWRAALNWLRQRRPLAQPYASAVTGDRHQSEFFARGYREHEAILAERPPRYNVKASLLVISVLLSLVLWIWTFDWATAMALILVLLVHECGHALAMRAFGYRDMSMFFVPFIGAMVTGRAQELPAWKQAVVLFAGPLPGIVAGLALLLWTPTGSIAGVEWRTLAVVAITLNVFNLLPVTPLDGGRLVELSLFSRWPHSRVLFSALSVGAIALLAVLSDSKAVWIVVIVLGLGLLTQLRAARLARAWREGLNPEQQLEHLFRVAHERFGLQSFARQSALVKLVLTQHSVRRPRAWESALTLSILLALWTAGGLTAYRFWPSSGKPASGYGAAAAPVQAPAVPAARD